VIWEPFILALVLGIIVSAGLYFAYLWPSVEPIEASDVEPVAATASPPEPHLPVAADPALAEAPRADADRDAAGGTAVPAAEQPTDAAAGSDAVAGPAASPAP